MKEKIFRNTPRWLVLQTDLFVSTLSLVLAFYLRFNFDIAPNYWNVLIASIPISLTIKALSFYFTKSYAGIIKYTSVEDAKRIFISVSASSLIFLLSTFLIERFTELLFIPVSVIIIDFALSILFMGSFRVLAKIMYYEMKNNELGFTNVVIYGAGEAGQITAKTIHQDAKSQLKVVAFIDDDVQKAKSRIEGVRIYTPDFFEKIVIKNDVNQVIIAIQNISQTQKSKIIEKALNLGVQIKEVPPIQKWIDGELSSNQIKNVRIEDLLGRDAIQLNKEQVSNELNNKIVLITGAAGSIGSELVRQIAYFKPKLMVLFDQAETPLYEMEIEILEKFPKANFEIVIGSVSNYERIAKVFKHFNPDFVFHAAAYKHVPMMEENPSEAILVNVFGTKNVADLSVKYKVEKFVLVSTDKAVNPTNVMGASKRIAELYTQSLNNYLLESTSKNTKFIATRFGNVLGSNGSVIPRFRKQIADGGPITITHPDITRYFMTIPEASQLVLEAAAIGEGGEVFLFDMGEPIKIIELAKKMIKLSGLELGKDIRIQFTGLRPGEKLYEELLTHSENTLATHHPKIMKGKFDEQPFDSLKIKMDELKKAYESGENNAIVGVMKVIVPEFKSNNSIFEMLDK